jgi:hypothetical protein
VRAALWLAAALAALAWCASPNGWHAVGGCVVCVVCLALAFAPESSHPYRPGGSGTAIRRAVPSFSASPSEVPRPRCSDPETLSAPGSASRRTAARGRQATGGGVVDGGVAPQGADCPVSVKQITGDDRASGGTSGAPGGRAVVPSTSVRPVGGPAATPSAATTATPVAAPGRAPGSQAGRRPPGSPR